MKVEHIIFDLDNTLYSSTSAMDAGITRRMMEAVADFFGVDVETAAKMRRENLPKFSTTLEWLRSEGLSDTEKYFAKVHPKNEADELSPDENLRGLISSISQSRVILTNSPREHAERVLKKLNVADLFSDIVDIRACGLQGKPYEGAYRTALEKCGGDVSNTIFVDDLLKYTDGFLALGGTAVLVGNQNGRPLNRENPIFANVPHEKNGKLFKINSIYFLPDLLNKF
ncbi:MAG: HAD-IA family hydrolase [Treponemataceae bacterium]|nr:HAD-IA family hydrolase [Treponemataceae bacterium]